MLSSLHLEMPRSIALLAVAMEANGTGPAPCGIRLGTSATSEGEEAAMTNAIPFLPGRAQLTAESWIADNPRWCFVRREARMRRCAWCRKRIAPGEEYYGTYGLALRWS